VLLPVGSLNTFAFLTVSYSLKCTFVAVEDPVTAFSPEEYEETGYTPPFEKIAEER